MHLKKRKRQKNLTLILLRFTQKGLRRTLLNYFVRIKVNVNLCLTPLKEGGGVGVIINTYNSMPNFIFASNFRGARSHRESWKTRIEGSPRSCREGGVKRSEGGTGGTWVAWAGRAEG